MLKKGQARLAKDGPAQESAQAAAIAEQLEVAERELANVKGGGNGS